MPSHGKKNPANHGDSWRIELKIKGSVQGVGFRPFVHRLAESLCLKGWVANTNEGVLAEVEGKKDNIEIFLSGLEHQGPPHALIKHIEKSFSVPLGYKNFEIRESISKTAKRTMILPDIATCRKCVDEIFDPGNRRYLYPFTTCNSCGPRFSIIEKLPFDRSSTSMKAFRMCGNCLDEYRDPSDRRFHAQTISCPECGPAAELLDCKGSKLPNSLDAVNGASDALNKGCIIAVKGIGGFHLIVKAEDGNAVRRLRKLKQRGMKPFALMYPSMESIGAQCELPAGERELLNSPQSPIVLLRSKNSDLPEDIAPGNPYLGVMLPYSPLHHILMRKLNYPVVATSGNVSDEPLETNELSAMEKLGGIADFFLIHNRDILRPLDDSVVRIMCGKPSLIRPGRGYAPLSVEVENDTGHYLAVGGQLKNTVSFSAGGRIFTGQHTGDLQQFETFGTFEKNIRDYKDLYHFEPAEIICDMHPAYLSTQYAERQGLPVRQIQHHHAHILSCVGEHGLELPVLGVSWDGSGYGTDNTLWGSEFLHVNKEGFKIIARFRSFTLPGGEIAVREPRRSALGMLYEIYGETLFHNKELSAFKAFSQTGRKVLKNVLNKNINSPVTTSAGRIFDSVSSMLGLCQISGFEGQAAMLLEFAIGDYKTHDTYALEINSFQEDDNSIIILNWEPMLRQILDDLKSSIPLSRISAKFHNTFAESIITVAKMTGEKVIALSGGCFQNRYLLEKSVLLLEKEGITAYWNSKYPLNDGGISFGQMIAASYTHNREVQKCV